MPVELTKDVFRPLYVYIVMDHERRKVIHYNCTFEPCENWVVQQLKNCFGESHNYKHMVHDRDSMFIYKVKNSLSEYFGIESTPTAPHSPWQNPFVERFNGTLRKELLNHVIVKDEFHLRKLRFSCEPATIEIHVCRNQTFILSSKYHFLMCFFLFWLL